MSYARRLAGARSPASPTTGSPRPDARTERSRLSPLLPALALLLGGLSPFAAAPAQAQTQPVLSLVAGGYNGCAGCRSRAVTVTVTEGSSMRVTAYLSVAHASAVVVPNAQTRIRREWL